jgi:hypothetical protein
MIDINEDITEEISRGLGTWFSPVLIPKDHELRLNVLISRIKNVKEKKWRAPERQQRATRGIRWIVHRRKILVYFAREVFQFGFGPVYKYMLNSDEFEADDADCLEELLRSYTERGDDIRQLIQAWFKIDDVPWQEEEKVLEGLRRAELECEIHDVSPFAVPDADDVAEEERLLTLERGLRKGMSERDSASE